MQGKVLDPTDLTAAYKHDGTARDVAVEITSVVLNVSPDVLTILSDVSETLLRPIQAASTVQPLYAVNAYEKICSSHHKKSAVPPFPAVGAGGLDCLGHEKGFTFWAPVAPPGHCILGHVLTTGISQPTHEVMCIALNSGIVKWPVSFKSVWHAANAYVWEPIPPPGYRVLGCMVTAKKKPPQIQSVVCVHERAIVSTPLGECLVRSGEGCLWAVDNVAGSFLFTEDKSVASICPWSRCFCDVDKFLEYVLFGFGCI
jgi:vacuolar protein sorting-associated protein 13A/C